MKHGEKIFPVSIKTKLLGHFHPGFWGSVPAFLWLGLWSFGLWHEYSVGRVNALFYAALVLLPAPLVMWVYCRLHLKPLFLIDDKNITMLFKKYEGRQIYLSDIEKIELQSGRADMTSGSPGQNEIYFKNYLLIFIKNTPDVIKLPLGITRYFAGIPGSFDRRKMVAIREKLLQRNIPLVHFDLSIGSQEHSYRTDTD